MKNFKVLCILSFCVFGIQPMLKAQQKDSLIAPTTQSSSTSFSNDNSNQGQLVSRSVKRKAKATKTTAKQLDSPIKENNLVTTDSKLNQISSDTSNQGQLVSRRVRRKVNKIAVKQLAPSIKKDSLSIIDSKSNQISNDTSNQGQLMSRSAKRKAKATKTAVKQLAPSIKKDSLVIIDSILTKKDNSKSKKSGWALGLNAGMNTIFYNGGIDISRTIKRGNSRLHLGGSYLYQNINLTQMWGISTIGLLVKVNTPMINLTYDWFPFEKAATTNFKKNFKLCGGINYILNPNYTFDATLLDETQWGSNTDGYIFTQENLGKVYSTITTNAITPFLGIGVDKFYSSERRTSLGFEVGCIWQGKPKVTMEATKMLTRTATQATLLESNLKGYQFQPYLKLQLRIKM